MSINKALPPYIQVPELDSLLRRGLEEDVGGGDVTSEATIPAGARAEASFVAREKGILAGLFVAERVFSLVDASLDVRWTAKDGGKVARGAVFGSVRGDARGILQGERLALNVLQRMSGIASATRRMVNAAEGHRARIRETRKTPPGLRLLDKWAVLLGGGVNHRLGLYDRILIKDNHIAASGGLPAAVEAARRYRETLARPLPIDVEARTLNEVQAALDVGGFDVLLLDNMVDITSGRVDATRLRAAVQLISGRCTTEATGNVDLRSVSAIAATGVHYISCGALTHSVRALNIALKIQAP